MSIMYAYGGVFPFGNNTISCYDDYCQFVPFISVFTDNIWSLQDPFFTYMSGGAATLPQSMFYCIISPFNIVYLLTPTVNAYYIYNIVHVLKMVAMANVMLWFISRRYSSIKLEYKVALSVLYACSSYVMALSCYTAWIDFMVYMPVLWHTFLVALEDRRILPLSISIAIMICNCYVLGVFALIIMAFIFLTYIFLVLPKESRGKASIDVVISYILGILFSMGVLYIAFKGVLSSDRIDGTSVFDFIDSWSMPDSLGRVAFLLFDFLAIIFAITYIVRCDKSVGKNKFLVSVTLFNILFNLSDTMYLISNGFSYNGFQFRLGFVTVFFIFIVAIHYFEDLSSREDTEYNYSVSKIQYISLFVVVGLCVGAFVIAIGYYKEVAEYLTNSISDGFMLVFIGVLVALFVIGLCILKQQMKHKEISFFCLKIALLIVAVSNVCIGNMMCVLGQIDYSSAVCIDVYQDFKSKYGISDADRVISMNLQQNLMLGGTNFNQFNSLIEIPKFVDKLDYVNSGVYVNYNNNLFVDSVMGYKYYFTDVEISEDYLELVYEDRGYYVYENKLALSNGLVLDNYTFTTPVDRVNCVNELYQYLGGVGDVYTVYTLQDVLDGLCPTLQIVSEYKMDDNHLKTDDCYIKIEFLPTTNSLVYVDMGISVSNVYLKFKDVHHDYADVCKNNEVYNINLYTYYYNIPLEDIYMTEIKVVDYDKAYALLSSLSYPTVDVEYNGADMIVHTTATSSTQSLVLTMPKLDNYTATINGKSVDISTTIGDLMLFDLVEGDNEIVITYHDTSNYTFIMCALLGITLGFVVYILRNKFMSTIDKCSTFMMYATLSFVVLYIAVFTIAIGIDMLCIVGIL